MADYVAAVDGGGTKTLGAFLSRSGKVQVTAASKGCNPQDNPQWQQSLGETLLQFPPLAHAVLGLPGFGEVAAFDRQMCDFAQTFGLTSRPDALVCMNDVELAFHGAFPDGDGILVLAGTGSMAMCQSAVGLVRAGGWGDMFGDEGSAFWIGRSALQCASQMRDGRISDTGFADLLSERLAIPQSDGFFGLSVWAMKPGHARSRIAAISLIISALADKGDVTSGLIIDSAAAELALHVQAVARLAQKPSGTPWTHAGSVFRSARLTAKLSAMLGQAPALAQFDALGGGLWQAAKAAGWPVDAAFRNQIKAGLGPKVTA